MGRATPTTEAAPPPERRRSAAARAGAGRGANAALLLSLLCVLLAAARLAVADNTLPTISIIIDDMGYRLQDGMEAIALPGPLAYSVLPHTPNAAVLARTAVAHGKEVLLHQPMQAEDRAMRLGPGALTEGMSEARFNAVLKSNLASVPMAIGVNNHMGSRLTQDPARMQWLMQDLKRHGGLFFVDSRTTADTVAAKVAAAVGLPHLSRDVFLDNVETAAAIRAQFRLLVEKARRNGAALAIAHPHPETLRVLAALLPKLRQRYGVRLVSITDMLAEHSRSPLPWQASLSRSPKDVKN